MFTRLFGVLAIIGMLSNDVFGQPQDPVGFNSDKKISSKSKELDRRLQGKWIVVEIRAFCGGSDSLVLEDADFEGLAFEFDGDELSIVQGSKRVHDWEQFTIDASQTPMWIDVFGRKGVVSVEGDTLAVCWGTKRPAGFDFSDRKFSERYICRRLDPSEGEHPHKVKLPKTLEELQGTWTLVGPPDEKTIGKKGDTDPLILKVSGNTAVWRSGRTRNSGSITVDESKNPMWIDFSDSRPFYNPGIVGLEVPPLLLKGVFQVEADRLTIRISTGDHHPDTVDAFSNSMPPMMFIRTR